MIRTHRRLARLVVVLSLVGTFALANVSAAGATGWAWERIAPIGSGAPEQTTGWGWD